MHILPYSVMCARGHGTLRTLRFYVHVIHARTRKGEAKVEMSFQKHTMVVRNEARRDTFALVHWYGVPPERLREAVSTAVTRWVYETTEGMYAWENSGRTFSIGELVDHIGSGERTRLTALLEVEGVSDLTIQIYTYDSLDSAWLYDDVLVHAADPGKVNSGA